MPVTKRKLVQGEASDPLWEYVSHSTLPKRMWVIRVQPGNMWTASATEAKAAAKVAARPMTKTQFFPLHHRIAEVRPGLSYLQVNKIKPTTQKKYLVAVELLLARLMLASLPKLTGRTWDSLLQEHLEYLFDHGHNKTDASAILAAILWLEPGLGGSIREACPWSSAALWG